ncbi:AraC family transcriptional regulator [Coraliomargarita sp. SDUM461004]|uniref:AraC family transcriptional regulator n=1 Tax=Thalassobacterium sedimentorum TaxID=3041258 RepID=A0ABU1AIZ3_9BACT|nr:AraC family transcriptional regulator [Coraliomargarita sp. SDUM461004]MDQ8194743.1 AraC family transcriptional regulator [Coraliomargarita sp. SDUM461004]
MADYTYTQGQRWGHLEVSPDVRFFMNHEQAQAEHAAHSHNYLELAFILGGRARHHTVRGESICRSGDLIVIPKGAWHGYSDCHELELVNCLFSPHLLCQELAWLDDDPDLAVLLNIGACRWQSEVFKIEVQASEQAALRKQLSALESIYQTSKPRTRLIAAILEVLEQLRTSCRCALLPTSLESNLHPSVVRALYLFQEQMDVDWRLEALAKHLRLDPSYLVRLFRAQMGQPPMKYLARMRAERAANYLLSTDWRIGEIGLKVGWPDPKVFARNFRRHFGMRASEYRKRMLGEFVAADE